MFCLSSSVLKINCLFTFQSLRHRQITSEFPTVPSLHLLPHNQVQFAIATATITIAAPNSLSTTVLPSNTYQSRKPCQTSKSNDPFQGLSTINKILQNRSSNIAKKLSMVQGGRSIHPRSIDAAAATTTNVTATAATTADGEKNIQSPVRRRLTFSNFQHQREKLSARQKRQAAAK